MGQQETKDAWFKAGHWLTGDSHRGRNEGFNQREIDALSEENSRPWGQSMFPKARISARAAKAQKQAKAKKAAAKKAAAKKAATKRR